MKTTILTSLHGRALFYMGAYEKAEKRIRQIKKRIKEEDSKPMIGKYLFTSKGEYEIKISEYELILQRINIWYIELSYRITLANKKELEDSFFELIK